jgi:hypothetical protein
VAERAAARDHRRQGRPRGAPAPRRARRRPGGRRLLLARHERGRADPAHAARRPPGLDAGARDQCGGRGRARGVKPVLLKQLISTLHALLGTPGDGGGRKSIGAQETRP